MNFPNPLTSFEEKKSKEYGLKVARLISEDWFSGGMIGNGCNFWSRREYIRNKRLLVRGESDNTYFKNQFKKSDMDLDYLNIDWSQVNWAEKFARIVSNGIGDHNYKLDVRATDRLSVLQRKKKEELYKTLMGNKEMLQGISQSLGVDVMPNTFVPVDEQEMQIYMEIKERPKIEIAEEILIDFIKESNNWDFIEEQKNKDLVDIGIIVARVWIDKNDGVKVAYVDPENYIHSPVRRNDFEDKYYEGVVENITLSDLRRESGFSDEDLVKIAKQYAPISSAGVYNGSNIDKFLDHRVDVLRFAYKTSKNIVFKAKKRKGEVVKLSQRKDNFDIPEREDVGRLSKTLDTWLEGNYVIGTDYIYDYRECENLYDDVMNKAQSPFITFAYDIYENRLRSFTDNIEAPARQLQKIHLKIQQLISELKPDLIEIDVDMLAELDDGSGGAKTQNWEMALSLLDVKGVVLKKRVNLGDDGLKDSQAVRSYPTQQGSALPVLLNTWAHYYNLIRENTGVNPARDGSLPANSLVGTNQMAQLASNTVTRNILDTAIQFNKKVAEVISTRLHNIYFYKEAKKLKDLYTMVVSKHFMEAMDIMKGRHLHEFGFTFRMLPADEELRDFNQDLTIALQEQSIDAEVKIEATRIAKTNVKLATQYLMYHRRRRMKERQQEQMMLAEQKSRSDAMAAQSKVQAETQAYQFKKEIDLRFEAQKMQLELTKEQALMELKQPTKDREFQQSAYLKQLEQQGIWNKEKFREDRKDERTKLQASQQSELIKQRQGKSEGVDFSLIEGLEKFS